MRKYMRILFIQGIIFLVTCSVTMQAAKIIKQIKQKATITKKEIQPSDYEFLNAARDGQLGLLKDGDATSGADPLIDTVSDINVQNPDQKNNTALHLASREGHAEVVNFLLSKGADPSIKNDDENTPIHLAARQGELDCLKTFYGKKNDLKGKIDFNAQNDDGNTALHLAVREAKKSAGISRIKTIAYLSQQNDVVNPNITNKKGLTPLFLAITNEGNFSIAAILVSSKGIDLTVTDKKKKNAIHLAAQDGNSSTKLAALEKDPKVEKYLTDTLKVGDQSFFELLVNKAPIQTKDGKQPFDILTSENDKGYTALHIAAYNRYKDNVNQLLDLAEKQRPDFSYATYKTKEAGTSLDSALAGAAPLIIEILIDRADTEAKNLQTQAQEAQTKFSQIKQADTKLEDYKKAQTKLKKIQDDAKKAQTETKTAKDNAIKMFNAQIVEKPNIPLSGRMKEVLGRWGQPIPTVPQKTQTKPTAPKTPAQTPPAKQPAKKAPAKKQPVKRGK